MVNDLPTLKDLNNLPSGKVALLILRCLNTSDLTWHYMLLSPNTLNDITENCGNLIQEDKEYMSQEEVKEAFDIIYDIKEYATRELSRQQ